MFDIKNIIIIASFVIMLLGLICVFHNRLKTGNGLGARFIQSITVIIALPTIIILASIEAIEGETISALLGSVLGYILSGIGDYKPESKKNRE